MSFQDAGWTRPALVVAAVFVVALAAVMPLVGALALAAFVAVLTPVLLWRALRRRP